VPGRRKGSGGQGMPAGRVCGPEESPTRVNSFPRSAIDIAGRAGELQRP